MKYLINQCIPVFERRRYSRRLVRLSVPLILLMFACACASVPHTGRRQFNVMSEDQMNALALKAFNEIVKKQPEAQDKRIKAIVKRVTDRVAQAAETIDHPKFNWDVRVIQNDKPNAFCLPGGKIVVFTGIMPYAKNEAGLAAIIGHEVAHAVARHGGERLSQRLALQGALSIGAEAIKGKNGKLSARTRLALGALGLGGMVGVILPFSRVHEFEADRIGQIYMARAGYAPAEAVRLWDRLSKIKKPPIPAWLSTHPADQDRVRKMREFLPDARKFYDEASVKHGLGSLL
jgi:predicted Zn-dependent protease